MSQAQEAVAIIDRATGNSVPAVLHTELDEMEIIDVEIAWSPERLQGLRELRKNKADRHGVGGGASRRR